MPSQVCFQVLGLRLWEMVWAGIPLLHHLKIDLYSLAAIARDHRGRLPRWRQQSKDPRRSREAPTRDGSMRTIAPSTTTTLIRTPLTEIARSSRLT